MFGVGIMSDTLEEGNETLTLTLSKPNPSDTVLGLSEATLVILDDDHPVPLCAPQVWYTVTLLSSPMDMAYDVATDRLFVANRDGPDDGSLSVVHAHSGETTRVVTGVLSARGVAFDAARNLIYVVGRDWLNVVDGMTYAVTQTLRLGTDVDAYAAAYNPANGKLYISGFNSHKIMIVNVANWSVTRINHTNAYPLRHPSYVAVNPITRKAYVTNHPGIAPSWVSVIDGDTDQIVNSIYLSGDLYGITADSVHNRVYVASISAARLYAVEGATDTPIGDIIIVRALDNRPEPLRMVAVNPSVGGNLHIWLTGSSGDWRGMDRLILLSGSDWQHLGQPRAARVAPSPEDGLVVDPISWNVFASSAASNLVTVSHDNATLCSTPLSLSEVEEPLYTIVNNYRLRERDR
jgi:DNA-binding beta-propeller fold protein YncE